MSFARVIVEWASLEQTSQKTLYVVMQPQGLKGEPVDTHSLDLGYRLVLRQSA